jgi:hypothetical protein
MLAQLGTAQAISRAGSPAMPVRSTKRGPFVSNCNDRKTRRMRRPRTPS